MQGFGIAGMVVFTAAIAVATFVNTDIGLIAILLSMLLSPELEAGALPGRSIVLRAEDLLLIVVSFTWLAKMAIKKTPFIRKSPLNIPIGLYVAVICFATMRGMLSGYISPLRGSFYVLKLIEYFLLFFIVLNQVRTEKQVKLFLAVLFLTAFVVGIYGNTHIGSGMRISAPFEGEGEPNTLGGYLLFIMSLLGGLIYCYSEKRRVLALLFIFLIPTFIFTLSRASYLGAIPALICFAVITRNKRVFAAIIGIFLVSAVFFTFGPHELRERIGGAFKPGQWQEVREVMGVSLGPSPAARVESWQRVIKRDLPKSPFFGRGITGTEFLDGQYILSLIETGIIGLIFLMWMMVVAGKTAFSSYRVLEKPLYKGVALGYIAGLAGLLTHAIGSNTFVIIRIAEPFWFFTAIVVKLVDIETGTSVLRDKLPRR
jgi:hypothetical protein